MGLPEGKKLSPSEFSLAAGAEVEEIDMDPDMGVGLDPSEPVLSAFHHHQTGVDVEELDVDEVSTW